MGNKNERKGAVAQKLVAKLLINIGELEGHQYQFPFIMGCFHSRKSLLY